MKLHGDDPVVARVRELAKSYLGGGRNPIETALELAGFRNAVAFLPSSIFDTFDLISSETDAIPLGERRSFWHPDVRAAEDAKHNRAQEWARPMMDKACGLLLSLLPGEVTPSG